MPNKRIVKKKYKKKYRAVEEELIDLISRCNIQVIPIDEITCETIIIEEQIITKTIELINERARKIESI